MRVDGAGRAQFDSCYGGWTSNPPAAGTALIRRRRAPRARRARSLELILVEAGFQPSEIKKAFLAMDADRPAAAAPRIAARSRPGSDRRDAVVVTAVAALMLCS